MRKHLLLNNKTGWWLGVCLLLTLNSQAQVANYVSNGSFESLNSFSATSLYNVVNYWQPIDTGKFCDYLATTLPPFKNSPYALGFQYARTGKNYIITQMFAGRGYPRNRLKQPLMVGVTYCVKFHVVNTNNNPYAIGSFGAYFASTDLDTITQCNVALSYLQPQVEHPKQPIITDTLNWIPITGTFVAQGGEKYMVIGNFRTDADTDTLLINPTYLPSITADICLDDVSVIPVDLPAYAGKDTVVFAGDSVFLGRVPDVGIDEACVWYKLPGPTPIDTIAGFWIHPTQNVSYAVRQEICGVVRWDTVHVYMDAVGLSSFAAIEEVLHVYPVPATQKLHITCKTALWANYLNHLVIIDVTGREIITTHLNWQGHETAIDISCLPPGVYSLTVLSENGLRWSRKLLVE